MTTMRERVQRVVFAVGVALAVGLAGPVTRLEAQVQPATPGPPARDRAGQGLGRGMGGQAPRIEVAELQRLFDAYLVMQAQDALQLDDVQFSQFLPKLKQLQETRRRNEQARQRIVAQLSRLTAGPATAGGEAALKERLQALQDLDGRAAAETRRAYDALDLQLDVWRQARFRVFEQNMERRKFQLMLRARRGAAGRLDPDRLP
jgi:hypothetical protein